MLKLFSEIIFQKKVKHDQTCTKLFWTRAFKIDVSSYQINNLE